MPELPEVETIRRGLADMIIGKTVKRVTITSEKSFIGDPEALENVKIISLSRRGKLLIIHTSGPYIAVHLRMTGQLIYVDAKARFGGGHPTDSLDGPLPDKHTRVTLEFTDDSHLFFNDQRKFGFVQVLDEQQLKNLPFLQKLGPEPLDENLTTNQFIDRFARKSKSNIKAAILDQSTVAGVGNIYADESLFLAQIHPETLVSALKHADFDRLLAGIRASMSSSLAAGGSTIENYRRADGSTGDYLDKFANVYGRANQPCPSCGAPIQKIRVAGRGTYFCPTCQKLKKSCKTKKGTK